jgi:ABC-2 type transport system ATP-binding protein
VTRGEAEAHGSAPALELAGVRVRFGDVTALDDASFHVPPRSVTGLVGRNGAGKSTAIHALAGLLTPERGVVSLHGLRHADATLEIRRRTGFVLAEPALFAYLTPPETLRFLAEAYGVPRGEADRRVARLIAFMELGSATGRTVETFSTGMRKRLALAAALVHAPRLLVLDEPFESLDPLIVRRIKRLLPEYAAAGGAVLLSSHLLDAVDETCDRVVILERGRVVVEATTAQARARVADPDARGALETLYASVVHADGDDVALDWLTPDSSKPARLADT